MIKLYLIFSLSVLAGFFLNNLSYAEINAYNQNSGYIMPVYQGIEMRPAGEAVDPDTDLIELLEYDFNSWLASYKAGHSGEVPADIAGEYTQHLARLKTGYTSLQQWTEDVKSVENGKAIERFNNYSKEIKVITEALAGFKEWVNAYKAAHNGQLPADTLAEFTNHLNKTQQEAQSPKTLVNGRSVQGISAFDHFNEWLAAYKAEHSGQIPADIAEEYARHSARLESGYTSHRQWTTHVRFAERGRTIEQLNVYNTNLKVITEALAGFKEWTNAYKAAHNGQLPADILAQYMDHLSRIKRGN